MTTLSSFSEEECLNVYWKIKNFSFCCGKIESPEFIISEFLHRLSLSIVSDYVDCQFWFLDGYSCLKWEISFLTSDGSPGESISGNQSSSLKVPRDVIFRKRRNSFLPNDTLTVRFQHPTASERGKVFFCSQIGVKRKCFLWTCENLGNRQCFERSIETSDQYGNIKLTLKSAGVFNTDDQLFIEISRQGGERCYFIFKVTLLDVNGKSQNEVSDGSVFEKENGRQTRVFPVFFKKSELLACKNLLLPNDTLSLKCSLAMSLGSLSDQSSYCLGYCADFESLAREANNLSMAVKEKNEYSAGAELQTDLKSILDDGKLFDATLQINNEAIKVHKIILSARSPVFKSMFSKDMKEAMNSSVVIKDLDVETVRRLLLYMYTDSIEEEQWENMKKLYFAADKYEVLGLKKRCVSFLKTKLSVANVCETLVLADLHQDGDLKTAAIDFISEYDSVVFTSEEWKEFEKINSLLAVQVMREIYCSKRSMLI